MITNKRYDYIDCIGGLLILHMIAFHIFQAGRSGLAASAMRPLSFFMFWFFFKSGVFYKPQMSHAIFYKGFYKLLVPYLIFSVLGYMLWLFRQILVSGYNLQTCVIEPIEELLSTGSLPGNVALWFLPSLLIVHLLFNFVKMGGGGKPSLVLLVSLSIACALHYSELSLPYYSENIPLGLSAYSFGYLTREYLYKPSVFFLALCCYMGILILFPSSISFRENEVIGDGSYMLAIVFSLAGCIVINNVFKRFVPHRCPVLYWIGCRTMDFYVPHMIVLTLCLFAPRVCVSWLKEIQCLMCIIILPLFSVCVNRYGLGWIFGKAKTMHV